MDRRWIVLAVVFVARTSMGYQFQSIGSVGPLLVVHLAIDFAVLGSLIGIYKLPGVLLSVPSGMLGNQFGEKSMLIFGMSLMAMGGFVTALSDLTSVIFAGRIISGVGAVLFNVLSAKMIADWFAGKELTLAFAIHVNSWPFGIALGLATQATFAQALSLNGMLSIAAIFCAIGGLLLWAGSQNHDPIVVSANRRVSHAGISRDEFILVSLAAMVWLLFNANLIIVVSFAPAYLTTIGFDVPSAGRLASIGTWLGILSVPLSGLIVQRWISAKIFIPATFLAGITATFAIVWLEDPLIGFIAFGIFAWAPAGPIFALPVQVLKQTNRAVGMGIYLSYYYLGIGIFPSIAGYIRDQSEDPTAPIIFAAWLLLGALVALIAFWKFLPILDDKK